MAESSTTNVNSLIINKVSRRTYKDMYDSGTLNNSQLYVIKDATLDAVGSRVINVATPELVTDAANMGYVASVANDIKQNLIGNIIYRGHITLGIAGGVPATEVVDGKKKLVAGATLADIMCAYIKNSEGLSESEARNYELDNGSAFQFTFASDVDDDTYTTANDIVITNKDCIIINNHETGGKVAVSQINRTNIDLIDIQYDTLVQRSEFYPTVNELNSKISAVDGKTNTNAQQISANASVITDNTLRLNSVERQLSEHAADIEANTSRTDMFFERIEFTDSSIQNTINLVYTRMPKYSFSTVSVNSDNKLVIPPFSSSKLVSTGAAFTVEIGEGEGGAVARDCMLVVECGNIVPDITWTDNFHPRTDKTIDFRCVENTRNIFFISEYVSGQFIVSNWQETVGGNK